MLKILCIGNEIRHELGCAASLAMLGYEVTYFHIGNENINTGKVTVITDAGSVKMNIFRAPRCSLIYGVLHGSRISKLIAELHDNFDLVITTPSVPFYIAYHVHAMHEIPILLRIWGIRACKVFDHVIYGKNYSEIFNFAPSFAHNLLQCILSHAVIVMDDYTRKFISWLYFLKHLYLVYPTYALIRNINDKLIKEAEKIKEITEELESNYILSIVHLRRNHRVAKISEVPLIKILYRIARYCPEINIIVAGSTLEDLRLTLGKNELPNNIYALGWIFSDEALSILYKHAKLVVVPIFYKSISNRLLEALFYGKPILTNSTAKELHNVLENLNHVLICDDYDKYPTIIRDIIKDEDLLTSLSRGAKRAYKTFFSSKVHGLLMENIMKNFMAKS